MRRRVLGLLCGCLLASVSGCGGAKTPEVTRTLDGAARRGYFVSPYSYEWYVRGELAMERGDFEGAADAFERALLGPEEDPYV
ncbi:MAG: tetratricopeptide repeat protein, partial [Myxococcales bacterium]|nr:tetratricopeptide repeat protein [Myxococcales bacterium]